MHAHLLIMRKEAKNKGGVGRKSLLVVYQKGRGFGRGGLVKAGLVKVTNKLKVVNFNFLQPNMEELLLWIPKG